MKKLWTLMIALLVVFALVGCKEDPSTEDYVLNAPTNLEINGTTLSWSAVDGADGYIIYLNGEVLTTTSKTTYDFSSQTGDVLIFQVQSDAPKGYPDSNLSLRIAYMVNSAQEIQAIVATGQSEEFAATIVSKGMTATEYEDFLDDIETMQYTVERASTVVVASTAFQDFLDLDYNYEAIIAGGLTLLEDEVSSMVTRMNESISELQNCDTYSQSSCDEMIDYYTQYLDMYNSLLETLTDDSDALLAGAMNSIDYLISVFTALDSDFFTTLNGILEEENPSNLNVDEILLIKDELVDALLEDMPSVQDISILFDLYQIFAEGSGFDLTITDFSTKLAQEFLLSIEAYAKMIDTIDRTYITNAIDYQTTKADTYPAEMIIMSIQYYDTFRQENEVLLTEIDSVFTEAEQEELMSSYSQLMGYSMSYYTSLSSLFLNGSLLSLLGDNQDAFFEWFDDSNGDIVRYIYLLDNLSYSELGTTEYHYQQDYYTALILKEVVEMSGVLLDNMDSDDFKAILNSYIDYLTTNLVYSYSEEELAAFETAAKGIVNLMASDVFALLKDNLDQTVTADFMSDYVQFVVDLNTHLISVYGTNYRSVDYSSSNFYYEDNSYQYGGFVVFEKWINEVISATDKATALTLVATLFDQLDQDAIMDLLNIDSTELSSAEMDVNAVITNCVDQASVFAAYDPVNITAAQATAIENFQDSVLD